MQCLHVIISGGKFRAVSRNCYESRGTSTARLIEAACSGLSLRDCEFLVNTGDQPGPIGKGITFSYSTTTNDYSRVCPDFLFDAWPEVRIDDYAKLCEQMVAGGRAPAQSNKIGWIGVPMVPARERLVQLGRAYPDLVEAIDMRWDRSNPARLASNQYLSLEDQARRWKYLIDVEGCGWSARLKALLWSGRVTFLAERPWKEWFFPQLQPWKHFVPVRRDLSDLLDNLRQLEADPGLQQSIAAEAQAFAREHLTRDAAVARWRDLLEANFGTGASRPASKPTPPPAAPAPAPAPSTPVAAAPAVTPAPSKPTFVVVTPPFIPNSAGVKVLHRLCDTINKLGFTCYLLFLGKNATGAIQVGYGTLNMTCPGLDTPLFTAAQKPLLQHAYVIYPESIAANPLNAPRVIRYYLNRDGYFPGDPKVTTGRNDFLVTFHRMFRPDAHLVLTQTDFNPVFQSEGTRPPAERMLDLTYVGKGEFDGPVRIIDNTLLVPRNWPPSQDQLAMLLRNARFVYNWDPMTSLAIEAVLCGAVPVMLRYGRWTKEELDSTELGPLPAIDASDGNLNFQFDPAAFARARAALEQRVQYLRSSWETRVAQFVARAVEHFGGDVKSQPPAVAA